MSLFHVYNKFDSMDLVHVAAKSEEAALSLAIKDGFLVDELCVNPCNLVVWPFCNRDNTSKYVRFIKGVV
tara:strand:- start:44 stop:253 length:210 start_codon:yes stop_codon:yes gene_type:complete